MPRPQVVSFLQNLDFSSLNSSVGVVLQARLTTNYYNNLSIQINLFILIFSCYLAFLAFITILNLSSLQLDLYFKKYSLPVGVAL